MLPKRIAGQRGEQVPSVCVRIRVKITLILDDYGRMISYRHYRNTDPPHLLGVWSECAGKPGLIQPLSLAHLERSVLNKPYFDPQGLIMAFAADRPVGFVHSGFGPGEDPGELDFQRGIICMLMVVPGVDEGVADELLVRGENYLLVHHAKTLYGGSASPCHPFYLGLYGGAQLAGIIRTDTAWLALLERHGYTVAEEYLRFELSREAWRPWMNPNLVMQFSGFTVEKTVDPARLTPWEALSYCEHEIIQYALVDPRTGQRAARVRFCRMDPNPHSGPAVGLVELRAARAWTLVEAGQYLLGEALRQLWYEGIRIVEAQCRKDEHSMIELLESFAFRRCTDGVVLSKSV